MRTLMVSTLVASGLALSGCAAILPAILSSAVSQGVGAAVGAATRGQGSSQVSPDLQNAAVSACTQQASQYGQASVTTLQQISSTTLRLNGTVAASGSSSQRSFTCSFRNDGRITDFRLG